MSQNITDDDVTISKKILKFAENKIIFIKLWIELKFWW